MDSGPISTKSPVSQWDINSVTTWLHQSHLGAFEKVFRDNEIDGSVLLKLSESMIVRLFPTIKLEVQFLDLLKVLRQRHSIEVNSKRILPPSPPLSDGRSKSHHTVSPGNASSSNDNRINSPSNSNSPTQIPRGIQLRALKRELKFFPNQPITVHSNDNLNIDSLESQTKHTFPHVYKLPQFTDTLRLALASQDASAFKLRTYYRNLLISSIYDDLTRTYNLWYPNARQYKTVASALVKTYPFLESSTDGGEAAWIDGIKGKFKRGRRSITSLADANRENGSDRLSEDEDLADEKLTPPSIGQKRSRHEFEINSNDGQYESGELPSNVHRKESIPSNENDEEDNDEYRRLRAFIVAMQETLARTTDPDISLIANSFKETFEIRRHFVKTHNTNEILAEYPVLQLHSCLLADFHMQTNVPIQTVLLQKLRPIARPIIRLAKETGCAPEILHFYHSILSQRPHLEQIVTETFAMLIVANYFGEYQFLFLSPDKPAQSPWPIIRGEHPARAFFDGKLSSLVYNIELDYVQLFHRPLNDFLTALCTLYATYTVFEITYGKLEMTLSFLDCLLREDVHPSTPRIPQVLELINELHSIKRIKE